jgi:hypothetical protein
VKRLGIDGKELNPVKELEEKIIRTNISLPSQSCINLSQGDFYPATDALPSNSQTMLKPVLALNTHTTSSP